MSTAPAPAPRLHLQIGSLGANPKTHKPRMLSLFYAIGGVGALLFALPQALSGRYEPHGGLVGTPVCSLEPRSFSYVG